MAILLLGMLLAWLLACCVLTMRASRPPTLATVHQVQPDLVSKGAQGAPAADCVLGEALSTIGTLTPVQ